MDIPMKEFSELNKTRLWPTSFATKANENAKSFLVLPLETTSIWSCRKKRRSQNVEPLVLNAIGVPCSSK